MFEAKQRDKHPDPAQSTGLSVNIKSQYETNKKI